MNAHWSAVAEILNQKKRQHLRANALFGLHYTQKSCNVESLLSQCFRIR